MVSTLCNAILRNQRIIYTLSTRVKGHHGITEDVFLSLPVVVGENGITAVFNQRLDEGEAKKVQESAKTLQEVIAGIRL
jgi:L-lactate dehydrogenase